MALHAATVEILVEKAKFEPKVALAVAEAIEFEMTQAQSVTVPVLDARIHEVRAEIRVLEGKVDAGFKQINATLDAKLDAQDAKWDAKYAKIETKLDTKLAEMEARLVRWVFVVMLGNVALSLAANVILHIFKTV